ncbi:hypothetical protein VKT23_009659 [Stygiomarasmius scandens]|uniref:Nephrocystin 3-like N-terminal domain-containing protein n=1 Tax=Marasmiellus scandens TaxID=2682957 RepID=A0ABR1JF82_9AGAR
MEPEPTGEVKAYSRHLEIKVLSGSNLAFTKSIVRKNPSFYVEIHVADLPVRYTEPNKDGVLLTGVSLTSHVRFNVLDQGLRLFSPRRRVSEHEENKDILGWVDQSVQELLTPHTQDPIILDLKPKGGQIQIQVEEKTANTSLEAIDSTASDNGNPFDFDENESTSDSLTTIINIIEKLGTVIQFVAAGVPYVQTIVSALSFFCQSIGAEIKIDKHIKRLIGQMRRLYFFIDTLEGKDSLSDQFKTVINAILKQTVECAYFLGDYSRQCFTVRVGKSILSNKGHDKIDDFLEAFMILGQSLDRGTLMELVHVSLRTEASLAALHDDIKKHDERNEIFRSLDPISYHAWESRPRCQEGTCTQTIDSIVRWVNNPPDPHSRVLWLHGLAGTGKSTIATTIADFYTQLNRLGAFIYFNRKEVERSRPEGVIRSMAYNLSEFDCRIRREVLKSIKANLNVSKMPPEVQFNALIFQPLDALKELLREGPIVIVIDALDECTGGENDTQQAFFDVLENNTAALPDMVRIIITARSSFRFRSHLKDPDREIRHITPYKLERSYIDVKSYIHRSLKKTKGIALQDLETLVQLADGLFIWAAVALRYILGRRTQSRFPERNLKKLVKNHTLQDLDGLYATALEAADSWYEEDQDRICAVLGVIMFAKTPLLPDTIDSLLEEEDYAGRIVEGLESVLDHNPGGAVTIPHVTFSEYLSTCSDKPWYIDTQAHKNALADHCLSTLCRAFENTELSIAQSVEPEAAAYSCRFWILHILEMMPTPNGFDEVLLDFLKKHLIHWFEAMSILQSSHTCAGLLEQLHTWVVKPQIFFSATLHQLIYDGMRFATFFSDTIAEHPTSISLLAIPFVPSESQMYKYFHHDIFPTVFGGYQCQWSRSLRVLRQLDKSIQCLAISADGKKLLATGECKDPLDEDTGIPQLRLWDISTSLEVIPAVKLDGCSVTEFSQDGTKIWCASDDGTLRELNAVTGKTNWKLSQNDWLVQSGVGQQNLPEEPERVSNQLEGLQIMKEKVLQKENQNLDNGKIAAYLDIEPPKFSDRPRENFSNAGILNTGTWHVSNDSYQQIKASTKQRKFTSIAFSPQQQVVILGQDNGELHIFDLVKKQTITTVPGPSLPNPPVDYVTRFFRSIVFDEAGSRFAVASRQGEIEIRDTHSGMISFRLKGDSRPAITMKFNADKLISSAMDGSIRIWDLNSRAVISNVQAGIAEREFYLPLCIDPSGQLIVSTTENGTMHIWDVQSGQRVGVLQGPCNPACTIMFSSDRSRMVSGAELNDIQIWDVSSFDEVPMIQRHDRPVHRVTISADGLCVRSWRTYKHHDDDVSQDAGGWDVKFWDVITGKELKMQSYDGRAVFAFGGSDVVVPSTESNLVRRKDEQEEGEEKGDEKKEENRGEICEGEEKECEVQEAPTGGSESNQSESSALEKMVRKIPLFLSEGSGSKEWSIPTEGYWVERIKLSNATFSRIIEAVDSDVKGIVVRRMREVDGNIESKEIWRLPTELGRCRSMASKGNVLTFGMWDGRVFSIYFPDEFLGRDNVVKVFYSKDEIN